MNRPFDAARNRGFTLLEMLVAVAILGVSLGALYQAVSGASRNVRLDENYTYAAYLAQSLMEQHAIVPIAGLQDSGETNGGFRWQVQAAPRAGARPEVLPEGALQDITVQVMWQDGQRERSFALNSVVQGASPEGGPGE